ncbi:MAG: TRAP transporter permease [Desulfobacteraceae bacterium]|nr:TRAP transporter permease [Desulfobacteraceae bacterium]
MQEKQIPLNENEEIKKYDPEMRFRQISGFSLKLVFVMTLILSLFHIYTAGFGVLQEWRHRAFHLAFVLPLVFMFYTIRKKNTEGKKHFIHDIIYALIGSTLLAVMFHEIFKLETGAILATGIAAFCFVLYFKRREFLSPKLTLTVDLPIFTIMAGSLVWIILWGIKNIDYGVAFQDLNATMFFWSVFLFGTLAALIFIFIIQWIYTIFAAFNRKSVNYVNDNIPYFDVFFAVLAAIASIYIFLEFNSLVFRAGLPVKADLVVGCFAILLVLEGARRSVGPPLPLIAFIVLINCYLGPYFFDIPGLSFFAHRGYSVHRIIEHMYLGTEGIFGIPLGVVATFVFHFVLFGIFISKTGLGGLFMDLAMAVAGGTVGGPAKVSVVSSGFLGSINGSSIANTVTTGAFTIPLMKRVGYKPVFAGAVEAAASTGGQLMPPIMGASAFIMAEFLGIPYIKIAACAVIPSFLHFFAVGWMVHLEAKKQGLSGLPKDQLPKVMAVLKEKGLLVFPLVIIVFLLISGASPFLAAYWGIFYAVAIGQIHRRTYTMLVAMFLSAPFATLWINPLAGSSGWAAAWLIFMAAGLMITFKISDRKDWLIGLIPSAGLLIAALAKLGPAECAMAGLLLVISIGVFYEESTMRVPAIMDTLEWGARNALAIGAACACVGFIVGATTLTGLGLKFATAVIELAGNVAAFIDVVDFTNTLGLEPLTLFFTLAFTAVACFLLGMGIPTTAQYIIASMIAAPALTQWGISPLVSHMFVLFYAVLADVTPPVALAGYAAAGISGGDPFKTGFMSFALSSAKLYVPFAFVYSPIILWMPWILDPNVSFNLLEFLVVFSGVVLGVMALGATIIGYLSDKSTPLERLGTTAATLLLLIHGFTTSLIGFGILAGVYFVQYSRRKTLELSVQAAA